MSHNKKKILSEVNNENKIVLQNKYNSIWTNKNVDITNNTQVIKKQYHTSLVIHSKEEFNHLIERERGEPIKTLILNLPCVTHHQVEVGIVVYISTDTGVVVDKLFFGDLSYRKKLHCSCYILHWSFTTPPLVRIRSFDKKDFKNIKLLQTRLSEWED